MEIIKKNKSNQEIEESPTIDLVLAPSERPKSVGRWIIMSLQHVFAMFGATVLVPMVINAAAKIEVINISMALFCSGIGTLIYILLTSAKVPIYLGSSFAYMTVVGTGYADWGNAVFIAIFLVGIVYILFGFIILWTGTKWILKTFSPIVVGPIIMVIGLSAIPSALVDAGFKYDLNTIHSNGTNYPQWLAIIIAVVTFLIASFFVLKAKGFLKIIPVLGALIVGYIFVVILHFCLLTTDIKLINTNLITDTSKYEWYPSFKNIFSVKQANIGPAALAIVPISLVTMVEHFGDHINLGHMTGKNFIKNPGIGRTLIADGVAMSFAGLIGGPANATYAENTSVVGITKVASVWVTGLAAIFAIIMSFIAPINQLIMMIPKPVLGGISMLLFGMIATNGIRVLVQAKINISDAKNMLVIAIELGIGIGMGVTGTTIHLVGSFSLTGLFIATFAGVLLNLLLPNQTNDGLFSWFKKLHKKSSQ